MIAATARRGQTASDSPALTTRTTNTANQQDGTYTQAATVYAPARNGTDNGVPYNTTPTAAGSFGQTLTGDAADDLLAEQPLELIEVAEMYALGAMLAEELPTAAADALGAGYDSPALCQLAGAHGADAESIRKLFRKSLGELGIPVPPPSQAGSAMARRVAGAIASGAVIPYDGARRIWWEIYARFPQLKELRAPHGPHAQCSSARTSVGLPERQVACEGLVENFLADVEFDLAELVVDGVKVGDQALVGGALEDADGADDGDAQCHGFGTGLLLIKQDCVGVNLLGQTDGIALPAVADHRGIHG